MKQILNILDQVPEFDQLLVNLENGRSPVAMSGLSPVHRAHFAAELIDKGYLSSMRESFLTILSPKRGLYTRPQLPDAFETIAAIKSMGAVCIASVSPTRP